MSASKSLPNRRPRPVSGVYIPLSPRLSSARSSVHYANELLEDMVEDGEQNQGAAARTNGKRALSRPGPPPKRDLPPPPLPPRDPLHKWPRKSAEDTSSHRHSLGCPIGIPYPQLESELSRSASEREAIWRKRKSREEWVKARKERDIQQARMMREKRLEAKLCDSGERNSESWREKAITPPSTPPLPQNSRPAILTPTPTPSPTSTTIPIPTPPSNSFTEGTCSTISALSASAKEMELEQRVLALERKNKMLEQTIMAVIRTGIGPSRKGSFLLQAKSLEEFLRELNLDE